MTNRAATESHDEKLLRCSICRVALLLLLFVCGCGKDSPHKSKTQKTASAKSVKIMKLTSSGFVDGKTIDAKYTVEGRDISPPLAWANVPKGTVSLALLCEDPDAPSPRNPADEPWVHWVLFNIPADRTSLPEGIAREPEPTTIPGAQQGQNSWPSGNIGYRGPAPPPGSGPHRYIFKIYALDTKLALKSGATKEEFLEAKSGHVLAEGKLTGLYER